MINKVLQGKKNRQSGAAFELRVRKDLEKLWVVSKWPNNVDLEKRKLVSAKHKFNPFSKVMSMGTGFPDFIAYKKIATHFNVTQDVFGYEVIGVESKVRGYLDRTEKMKCKWLLDHDIFAKILIASKDKEGCIQYKEYDGNNN